MKFAKAWPRFARGDIALRRVSAGWRKLWIDAGLSSAVLEAGHLPGFFVGGDEHVA